MTRHHIESDPDAVRRHKPWWQQWQKLAAMATVIVALPTAGMYGGHVIDVWDTPAKIAQREADDQALTLEVQRLTNDSRLQTEALGELRRESKIHDHKLDQIIGYLRASDQNRLASISTNEFY